MTVAENTGLSKRIILIFIIVEISVFQSGVDFQLSTFMYYPPPHFCIYPNQTDVSASSDNCHYVIKTNNTMRRCRAWTFDNSQIKSTVVTDLSLVCQYQYLQYLIILLRNISSIFNLLLSFFSDLKGRKVMFLISIFLDSFFWIILGVIPTHYLSHTIARSLKSAVSASTIIGFVLLSELTPTKYINIVAINYWVPFSLGLAVAPFYMWVTYHWKTAWLLASFPNIAYLAAPFIILESPQWLSTNNRKEESDEICEKLNLHFERDKYEMISEPKSTNHDPKFCKELLAIMSSCTMVSRLMVLLFTSFIFYFVYQGISANATFASPNIYINAIILGLIEVPSGPISSMSSQYFGPVFTTVIGLMFSFTFYVIYNAIWISVLPTNVVGNVAKLVLACVIRFMISGSWNVQGLFYVTLIPTTVRNFCNNLGEILGRFGGGVGGLLGYALINSYLLTGSIFGGMIFLSIIFIALVIPTVGNVPLPQTVEESKLIKKEYICNMSTKEA